MRLIKLAVISFVVLGLLVTAMSSLLPSTVYVARTINIDAPKDTVFAHISNLVAWKQWYAYMDSSQVTYGAVSAGAGASLKVDKTTIIINSISSDTITATWQSADNRPLRGSFTFKTDSTNSQTAVQWEFIIPVKWYPWEKFASIVSDKALGGVMEKSLDKLKSKWQ